MFGRATTRRRRGKSLIGVDEKAQNVVGADAEDMATWWPQVQKHFDEIAPEVVRHFHVLVHEKPVVAILFDATRVPYVVQSAEAQVQREVPWRGASMTRSARRSELLELLVAHVFVPAIDVRSASVVLSLTDSGMLAASVDSSLYLVPTDASHVVIPFHRCQGGVVLDEERYDLTQLRLSPPQGGTLQAPHNRSLTIDATNDELIVAGPGIVRLTARFNPEPITLIRPVPACHVSITLAVIHAWAAVRVEATLRLRSGDHDVNPKRTVYSLESHVTD